MRKTNLLVFLLLISSCSGSDNCQPNYFYQDQTTYEVNPEFTTSQGIDIDTTGQNISLELIDQLTDEVEDCLIKTFGFPPIITERIMQQGMCLYETFELPINRECLTVKIPDDWILSCKGDQQVLPALAPAEYCIEQEKGIPTSECPCRWRAGIQDNLTIVTTPSLYLYKDPLIRIVTGCNNPWGHPALAHCATPSTPPL